jgi:flagellum-specific peptidoglycan hydrolase FlgJ
MDYTVINGAHEVRADGSIYVPEVNRFRSYNSHRDGVADMLRVLSCQSNFSAAWDVLMHAPDPEAYVRAAKKGRYFTGNVEEYVRAVVSICREFDRRHG